MIQPAAGSGVTLVVAMDGDGAFLKLLTVNAANGMDVGYGVGIENGNENKIVDTTVKNAEDTSADQTAIPIGVFILCSTECNGNVLNTDVLSKDTYGISFVNNATNKKDPNAIRNSTLTDDGCAGVAFESYGVVDDDTMYDDGYLCPGGLPANTIYANGNMVGGLVEDSTLYDTCGNNVDFLNDANFTFTDNSIANPGYAGHSEGPGMDGPCYGVTMNMSNVSNSVFTGNTLANTSNSSGITDNIDRDSIYENSGQPAFSDLPNEGIPGDAEIALVLAYIDHSSAYTADNDFSGNRIIGYCNKPCLGIGYFASRGTGYGRGNSWSASTTDYYTANNPMGSNIGSIRGGANWYAASSVCTVLSSQEPCNTDDYQHSGPHNDEFQKRRIRICTPASPRLRPNRRRRFGGGSPPAGPIGSVS